MTKKIAIIVPARVASTRFPKKLLHNVRGKPVILWTAERIRSVAPEIPLHFAVDNIELKAILEGAGFDAVMTDVGHTCGTDRIAEANQTIGADPVINVQADEPMVTGGQIRQLVELIEGDAEVVTLGAPLVNESDYFNSNHVKCICDRNGRALYFSRAAIPYFRDRNGAFDQAAAAEIPVMIHLGLYAYKGAFLDRFSDMDPGRLEQAEKLEMLRVIESGYHIQVGMTNDTHFSIDTVDQAAEFEAVVKEHFP
jgi:3-deoxy-manno-octulosonate cytidylyltransferase (CMP-KDO synthetase)